MKVSFRVTLVVAVCGLILAVSLAFGLFAHRHAAAAADDLGDEIADQTAARVRDRVTDLLAEARAEVAAAARVVRAAPPTGAYREALVARWGDALATRPDLTACCVGVEATGEVVGVSRLGGGRLTVWELTRGPRAGKYRLREYAAADYPANPFVDTPEFDYAIRTRPWYAAAVRAAGPAWTDAYLFSGARTGGRVPGVTFAVPVNEPGGSLRAVVSADFELGQLCDFLARAEVGRGGFAVLIEVGADGGRRLIGHPRRDAVFDPGTAAHGPTLSRLGASADPVLRELDGSLPADAGEREVTFPVTADGRTYLANVRPVGGADNPRWLVGVLLPEDEILGPARRGYRAVAGVGVLAVAVALLLGMLISSRVSRPLERIAEQVAAIGRLEFPDQHVRSSIIREVDDLVEATERMKVGLRSFERYVPTDLVRLLVRSGAVAELGGERRELTFLFADIADFTTLAETMPGEALVLHLADYFAIVSGEIAAARGTVDKYIGDAVMAFWNAPVGNPDHPADACRAAVRCQRALATARARWAGEGKPLLRTRIGVHTGEAVIGNIGSPTRMNYTAVGDAVNLASRLEGLNKENGTDILISESTYRAAADVVVARPLGERTVKGRVEAVTVYELLGLKGETDPAVACFAGVATAAFNHVKAGRVEEARPLLTEAIAARPNDPTLLALSARVERPA